ncbi:MAG: PilT domain-containing protein [bacterium]|nr:MAG: PilT domain-containing protein [bacterium]
MKILIDTCSFLWFIEDNPKLSSVAKSLIEDEDNEIFLSIISVWEIAIKTSIGKLSITDTLSEFIKTQLKVNDIKLLNISLEDTYLVSSLPFHHKDPFDRLIISQAITGKLPIISYDSIFDSYSVSRLW